MALQGLAQAYLKSGKHTDAVALIAQLPDDAKASSMIGYIYGVAGEGNEAKKILAREMQRSTREYVSPTSIARIHVGLGNIDQAIFWLQKSYYEHSPDLPILSTPYFDNIRSDPRFVQLVNRVG
jgi:predicted Zn-dependent protease